MRMLNGSSFPVLLLSISVSGIPAASAQVDVLTHRYDNARSGVNLNETVLNKSNITPAKFGKLAFRNVDGNIYAQPLIVSQAKITGRTTPVNVAIVATEANSIYAFDADDTSPDQDPFKETKKALWHTGPGDPNAPTPQDLGRPVHYETLNQAIHNAGCVDLTTEIGITGTPAIKLTQTTAPKQGVIFAATKSIGGNPFTYRLFALRLSDGHVTGSGVPIEGSVTGPNGTITFDPRIQLNRPALLLNQNVLYIAFGSHCDTGNYRGWVFAYDVSNPVAPKKLDVFSSTFTPRGQGGEGRGGIWMSGYGVATDGDGAIYFVTGDGTYNVANPSFPELSNTVVKAKLVSGKFQLQDWFSPQNRNDLKTFDADLGSGGAVLVPTSHVLLAGGKEGRMYLIDRNDMGRGSKISVQSFQVTNNPLDRVNHPRMAMDRLYWNIHGAPIVWAHDGQMFVYVMGEEDFLKQYRLLPDAGPAGWKFDTAFKKVSKESVGMPNPPNGLPNDKTRNMVEMPGGFLTLSGNGSDAGSTIVWATMPFAENANLDVVRGALRAFDASDVSLGELWDSEKSASDNLGFFAKFNPPVVANGKVFVATFHQETVDINNITKHMKTDGGLMPALVIYGLR